ncbi:flap endonuclease-1 [Candidatus Woesearchaeota archaeon]|nr:flap endonuclease-1 [Candidatus Woesearchaeota archaeon]
MGVNITDLLARKEIDTSILKDKIIAVDAHLFLYQFLTTIRQRDGALLMDSQGRVTSHLSGLFARNTKLMQQGLRLAYVFDGKPPKLKEKERERRKSLKVEAEKRYEQAKAAENIEEMKKYAARTTRLTKEMIEEAKQLLHALGIPVIEAPSEGEAQAAHLVKGEKAFAVASQDSDALMFGTPRLIRNLSIAGRRKRSGKLAFETIKPEMVSLADTLNNLSLDQDQLIALGMLVGTDFNDGGIKGIGPQKAIKLLEKHKNDFDTLFKEVKWEDYFDYPWTEVFYLFKKMPVHENVKLEWEPINREKINEILVEGHDFSEERINSSLDRLEKEKEKQTQKGLGEFI